MSYRDTISAELIQASEVLQKFLADPINLGNIEKAALMMVNTISNGGKIISCGNGGSLCDAMHFAEELTGKFRDSRKPVPAIAISDPGHITCVANDFGYDQVFSRFIEALGNKGDCLLAISTSGNSENVVRAANAAHDQNIKVIALTGNDGGQLASKADVEIRAPHQGYSDRIQEVHMMCLHILIEIVERIMFPENYK